MTARLRWSETVHGHAPTESLHRAPARRHDALADGAPWWAIVIRTCLQLLASNNLQLVIY